MGGYPGFLDELIIFSTLSATSAQFHKNVTVFRFARRKFSASSSFSRALDVLILAINPVGGCD
jgi:hypothetical protein